MQLNKKWTADICLLFVALVWGTTFVIVQDAISFIEPFTFNAIRFFIAASLLFLYGLFFRKSTVKQFDYKVAISGALLGFWLFIGYGFQTLGLLYTTSSKAGFITGLSVVLVPIICFFIFRDKISTKAIIGVMLAATGLYMLTVKSGLSLNFGDGFVLICALGFAMHIVFTGKYAKSFSPLLLTIAQLFTVSILSTASGLIYEDFSVVLQLEIYTNPDIILTIIVTSVLATALAFILQTYFQQYTTPTRVAIIFAMEPVFAAITAVLFNNERLGLIALIGCLFILTGMILAELPQKKKRSKNRVKPLKDASDPSLLGE